MVNPANENRYLIDVGLGTVTIEFDRCLRVKSFNGSEDPIGGWVSRGYHQKKASTTLIGRCTSAGKSSLVCRVRICEIEGTGQKLND